MFIVFLHGLLRWPWLLVLGCLLHQPWQLLGIKVSKLSASDIKRQSYDMIKENMDVTHWAWSLADQTMGSCKEHYPDSCDQGESRGDYDVAVCGTPCQPFSMQRTKRTLPGSVKNHGKFSTTMDDLVTWLEHYQPKTAVAEQVEGLGVAESTDEKTTPLQRQVGPA